MIKFFKQDDVLLSSNQIITLSFTAKCGGTLINRNTVMTAAHCILKTFSFQYNGKKMAIRSRYISIYIYILFFS